MKLEVKTRAVRYGTCVTDECCCEAVEELDMAAASGGAYFERSSLSQLLWLSSDCLDGAPQSRSM